MEKPNYRLNEIETTEASGRVVSGMLLRKNALDFNEKTFGCSCNKECNCNKECDCNVECRCDAQCRHCRCDDYCSCNRNCSCDDHDPCPGEGRDGVFSFCDG